MEMPTPCEACDELFDLLDGKESPRRDGVIICVSCAKEQQEEIDYEAEITSLRDQISDAEYTLAHAKARLEERGVPPVSVTRSAPNGASLVSTIPPPLFSREEWARGKGSIMREKSFEPNASSYKEYPEAFGGVRYICALHKFADGDLWLLKFDTSDGQWKRVRTATTQDQTFFSLYPLPTTVEEVAFAEQHS